MIRKNIKANSIADIGKTIQGLSVDLQSVYESHKVPPHSVEVIYNQIQDLKEVGFRIDDTFDGIMLSRLQAAGLETNAGTGSSQVDGSKDVK